jgi:uncharacterized protein YndB with AHSA1/START domain
MAPLTPHAHRQVTLERTFRAPVEDVWELWTTKAGIEFWWGPDGFTVEVRDPDLRPGGELAYVMIATGPEQIEYLRQAGMRVTNEHRLTFTEVVPWRRLAYTLQVDFIPGVQPYEVATSVDLEPGPEGVRMVLTLDAMHDEHSTRMALMGWESELDELARLLEGARPPRTNDNGGER